MIGVGMDPVSLATRRDGSSEPAAPVIVSASVTFAGDALRVGDTAMASVVWTGFPQTGVTYQWTLDGSNIGGATGGSYTTIAEGALRVVVNIDNGVAPPAGPVTSDPVTVEAALAAPAVTVASSSTIDGRLVTVQAGSASGNPAPVASIAATLDAAPVSLSGSGPWTFAVPSDVDAATFAWTVTWSNDILPVATSSGSREVAGDLFAPSAEGSLSDLTLTVGVAYDPVDASTGISGTAPVSYALAPSSDALPSGFSLSSLGVLTVGTPSAAAASRVIVVRASNAHGFVDRAFTLVVDEAINAEVDLDIIAATPETWFSLPASETWTLDSGTLPTGVTLSSGALVTVDDTTAVAALRTLVFSGSSSGTYTIHLRVISAPALAVRGGRSIITGAGNAHNASDRMFDNTAFWTVVFDDLYIESHSSTVRLFEVFGRSIFEITGVGRLRVQLRGSASPGDSNVLIHDRQIDGFLAAWAGKTIRLILRVDVSNSLAEVYVVENGVTTGPIAFTTSATVFGATTDHLLDHTRTVYSIFRGAGSDSNTAPASWGFSGLYVSDALEPLSTLEVAPLEDLPTPELLLRGELPAWNGSTLAPLNAGTPATATAFGLTHSATWSPRFGGKASSTPYYDVRGFGDQTTGGVGDGMEVVFVTNLSTDPATEGSLPWALAQHSNAPLYVCPVVEGAFNTGASEFFVDRSNLTLDFRFAPGNGCWCIGRRQGIRGVFEENEWGENIKAIMPMFLGNSPTWVSNQNKASIGNRSTDTAAVGGTRNVVIERGLFLGQRDESLSTVIRANDQNTGHRAQGITIDGCIIGVPAAGANTEDGTDWKAVTHDFGSLIGDGTYEVTMSRSMFTRCRSRNPHIRAGDVRFELSNVLVYNWRINGVHFYSPIAGQGFAHLTGMAFKEGPFTGEGRAIHFSSADEKFYHDASNGYLRLDAAGDEIPGTFAELVTGEAGTIDGTGYFTPSSYVPMPAADVPAWIAANAGPKVHGGGRHPIAARLVADMEAGLDSYRELTLATPGDLTSQPIMGPTPTVTGASYPAHNGDRIPNAYKNVYPADTSLTAIIARGPWAGRRVVERVGAWLIGEDAD